MERVRENLDLATPVYITCVNHSPCGETVIHLFESPEYELKLIGSKCLLPEDDVLMWLQRLQTIPENRKQGESKAAETRRNKKYFPCGVCQALYEEADEVQLWIAGDGCNTWFHGECVNVSKNNEPDELFCESCALRENQHNKILG